MPFRCSSDGRPKPACPVGEHDGELENAPHFRALTSPPTAAKSQVLLRSCVSPPSASPRRQAARGRRRIRLVTAGLPSATAGHVPAERSLTGYSGSFAATPPAASTRQLK